MVQTSEEGFTSPRAGKLEIHNSRGFCLTPPVFLPLSVLSWSLQSPLNLVLPEAFASWREHENLSYLLFFLILQPMGLQRIGQDWVTEHTRMPLDSKQSRWFSAPPPPQWKVDYRVGPPRRDSDQISRSVMSDSLQPHESQHTRPPCPSPTPRVHSDSHPLSQWWHPAMSSSVVPFSSCPQSLPASESFPMSQLFAWGG